MSKRMLSKSNEPWLGKMLPAIHNEYQSVMESAKGLGSRLAKLKGLIIPPNRHFHTSLTNRDMAHILGMSAQNYPRLENAFKGDRKDWSYTIENLILTCVMFRVSADFLLFGKQIYKMPLENQETLEKPKQPEVDMDSFNALKRDKAAMLELVSFQRQKIEDLEKKNRELQELIDDMTDMDR